MNLFKNKIGIKVFIAIISVVLISSCSSKTEEKELPSYFCNQNLERYFTGDVSLPIININPNDSFGVLKDTVLSLLNNQSVYLHPTFRFPFVIDSSLKTIFIKNSFISFFESCASSIPDLNWRNILEVMLTSEGSLLIEGEIKDVKSVRKIVFNFILNKHKDANYSDNPMIATVLFQRDSSVNSKKFNVVLKGIIDGYSDALNYESDKKFNKLFCNLTSNESTAITDSIPFNFHLEYPETNLYYFGRFLRQKEMLLN